ncbi:MAG: hypothetical protein M5T52_02660 [Ignavibacteriaceae bacterium]|nr:hypothetical protein [Ignavibacteriaceae bacterium]
MNEKGFESLVLTKYDEYVSNYPMNGKKDLPQIEEKLTIYFVETKSGEKKWIEDNSISFLILNK